MKKLFVRFSVALLICALMLTAVGCGIIDNPQPEQPDVGEQTVDKSALEAELALEITELGDYDVSAFGDYEMIVREAKLLLEDENATQESVDRMTERLSTARLGLTLRTLEAATTTNTFFRLVSGETKSFYMSDYILSNSLSNVTYDIKASNAVVSIGALEGDVFTVTAGEVNEATYLTLTLKGFYKGQEQVSVELSLCITNDVAPVLKNEAFGTNVDVFNLSDKNTLHVDFSENVDNSGNIALTYSAKLNGQELELEGYLGDVYALSLGQYTENYEYLSFEVSISFEANGEAKTISYIYTLGIKDTTPFRAMNGCFELGSTEGWEIITTQGDQPFGGMDWNATFWGEGYSMHATHYPYFSAYAEGASEASHGRLISSYFIAGGEYATYMLGGGGNRNVYITIENKAGEVLAVYRNEKFADFPQGDYSIGEKNQMIGNTVFLANFVTYKVSIAEFAGQEIRFVIHDYASSGWGVVFFDELVTYYAADDALPEGAVLASNRLADKAALKSELALEVTEQGDYTLDSFNAYLAKLAEAKEIADNVAASQTEVDNAVKELSAARLALTVRPVEAVPGANTEFRLTSKDSKEITISDYVNTNGLSGITYKATSNSALIYLGDIKDGRFTITAGEVSEATSVNVTITVYHNGFEKLAVKLTVQITNDLAPTLFAPEVAYDYDLYELANKDSLEFDLSKNVDNAGNLALSYSVDGAAVSGSGYTFKLGKYTDTATIVSLKVSVSYTANGQPGFVEYYLKLALKDTTELRLVNGGFENGLEGWTQVGNIGGVSSDTHYWVEEWENNGKGYEFGLDGKNMFSAYAPGAEEKNVGTLTSSTFKVGGSGYVTFKLGAAKDGNYVYVDVVDADTKEILARYYNGLWAENTDGLKSGCTLISYKADLSAFVGREVFFRISDNADSGYGLFFVDSFETYYENEPDGFNYATSVDYPISGTIYDLFNGSFEMGNLAGWWNNGEIGVVTDAHGYWGDNIAYEKVGTFLFTGVESFGADTMREGNKGSLTSSVFEIGGTGWISFKLGGGGHELCYVQIIDAVTGEILAKYHQQAQRDAVLIQYVADLSAYIGRTARIQVIDQASSGWGCVSFDHVVTYYPAGAALPEGIVADNIKPSYEIKNGSFENGLEGWHMNIWEAGAHNTLGWVESSEHDAGWYTKNDDRKDGNNLFTFCQPNGTNCENTKGELVSSTFALKQNSYVSFRFGGAGSREVRIELVKADGTVIARFYNEAPGKANTEMYAYYYQYTGETTECFFRVVDDSVSNYGCFVVDDFRVNLESAPEGFMAAIQ